MNNQETQNIESLPLEKIRIDGGTQSRVRMDKKVVAEYAELLSGGTELPPVIVFFDGVENWLADGFHRYTACTQINRETILADIRNGSQRDAILFSLGANAAHGLRRSNDDKKKTVLTMLQDEEWQQWSNCEIARQCGVSEFMVRQMRSDHTSIKSKYENTNRTFIHPKSGKQTSMKVNKIGVKTNSADPLLATDPNLAAHDIVMSMGNDYAASLATAIQTYLEITSPLAGKSLI